MPTNGNGKIHYEDFLLPPDAEVTLPSGMPATLRTPRMEYYLKIRSLPGRLAAVVRNQAALSEIDQAAEEDAISTLNEPMSPEEVEEQAMLVNLLLCEVFVTPQFSLEPQEGQFHPSRLRIADRTFVTQWTTERIKRGSSANALESFRVESEPGVAGGSQ